MERLILAENCCQSCFRVLNIVAFILSFVYEQLHSVTELLLFYFCYILSFCFNFSLSFSNSVVFVIFFFIFLFLNNLVFQFKHLIFLIFLEVGAQIVCVTQGCCSSPNKSI